MTTSSNISSVDFNFIKMQKRLFKTTTWALCVVFLGLLSKEAQATHSAGGEIVYNHISDSTYQFIYKFYRFCGPSPGGGTPASAPNNVTLCGSNSCNGNTISQTMNKMASVPGQNGNGNPVDPGCANFPTRCTSSQTTLPGYQEWWYMDTIVIPSTCNTWTFSVGINARNPSDNLQNAGGTTLFTEVTFNNALSHNNSSPRFLNPPVPYVCINSPFSFNHLGFDPDGDSLVYFNINPKDGNSFCPAGAGTNITYVAPYNVASPLPSAATNPFSFNNITGQIDFTPTQTGYWALATRVDEYRNGVLIGSSIRDVQVVVINNCNNINPGTVIDTANNTGQLVGGYIRGCPDELLQFCFSIYSPDTAVQFSGTSSNQVVIPTSTVGFSGVGTDTLIGCFKWQPTIADTGIHTFTVTAKDTSCRPPGIVNSQTFSYSILIPPPVKGLGDTSVCSSDTAFLYGVEQLGDSLVWSVISGDNNSLSCTSCDSVYATPNVTTVYQVTNVNSQCAFNYDTVVVSIIPPPLVDIGYDDTVICQNSSVTFSPVITPPGAYGYLWTPNQAISSTTTLNTTVTPIADTWYYLDVTELNAGCAAQDSVLVRVIPTDMHVLDPNPGVCEGDNVQLDMAGTYPDSFSYAWTPGNLLNDSTIINPIAGPDTTTLFRVDITRDGCLTYSDYALVTVEPNPTVDLGPDVAICQWDTLHFPTDVQPDWFTNYSYQWSQTQMLTPPNVPDPTLIANFPGTHAYTLTASTPLGCSGDDDIEVTIHPGDFMTVDSTLYEVCVRESVQLEADGAASYTWVPGTYLDDSTSATPTTSPSAGIVYTVYGTSPEGCLDTAEVKVIISPSAILEMGDDVTVHDGESVQLFAQGNCTVFAFSPSSFLDDPTVSNPVVSGLYSTTEYIVSGSTINGCIAKDTITVIYDSSMIVVVPNAFTPNGGEISNTLKPIKKGQFYMDYFRIYNRWGQLIYETNDINAGWDGSFKGEAQPIGTYVYELQGENKYGEIIRKNGTVTLIK